MYCYVFSKCTKCAYNVSVCVSVSFRQEIKNRIFFQSGTHKFQTFSVTVATRLVSDSFFTADPGAFFLPSPWEKREKHNLTHIYTGKKTKKIFDQ